MIHRLDIYKGVHRNYTTPERLKKALPIRRLQPEPLHWMVERLFVLDAQERCLAERLAELVPISRTGVSGGINQRLSSSLLSPIRIAEGQPPLIRLAEDEAKRLALVSSRAADQPDGPTNSYRLFAIALGHLTALKDIPRLSRELGMMHAQGPIDEVWSNAFSNRVDAAIDPVKMPHMRCYLTGNDAEYRTEMGSITSMYDYPDSDATARRIPGMTRAFVPAISQI